VSNPSETKTVFAKVWSFIKGFPGKLRTSRLTLIITVLVVLAAAGWLGWHYYTAASKKSGGYTTATAASGNIQVTVSASGNVIAVQSVALTFKSQGYVQSCNVNLGDLVASGQILATEQTSDLQASLDQAEASLQSAQANYNKLLSTESQEVAQAQAQVDQAKTALADAKDTLDRDQQLLGIGTVSQTTVDSDTNAYQQATTQLDSAQYTLAQDQTHADVVAAGDQVESAQSQEAQAQSNLTDANIIAPFSGYISTISGNPGMWTGGGAVASGTSTATQFEIIMTSTQLEIDGDVNEADISKVSIGQLVTFTVDTYPTTTFTGRIIALSPSATTVSNVQMYEARMSIDDYSKLKSGLPATISIITASANNVLIVPKTALLYVRTYQASLAKSSKVKQSAANAGGSTAAQSAASSSVVMLVNGQPQVKKVVTGLTDSVNVEIISGLNAGDLVVTGSTTAAKAANTTTTSASQGGGPPGGF
jgi:HlyD family secretion protein